MLSGSCSVAHMRCKTAEIVKIPLSHRFQNQKRARDFEIP